MKKLVIIPAYNESGSIARTVEDIRRHAPDYDLVVINDCSTDDTLQICRSRRIPVLDLPVNLGIGGAVQTGYRYAFAKGYDVAVQMDGDGQHDARYLGRMEQALLSDGADLVIGSRFLEKEGFQSSGIRRAGIRFFRFLTGLLFGTAITDSTSGMRMANRRTIELFMRDYPRDYPEPETVCRLLRKKYRVEEVPVVMRERLAGVSSISLADGVYYMVKVTLAILVERTR